MWPIDEIALEPVLVNLLQLGSSAFDIAAARFEHVVGNDGHRVGHRHDRALDFASGGRGRNCAD